LSRSPANLRGQAWFSHVETVDGDVVAGETLDQAMEGVSEAYYMIHSMTSGQHYHERDVSAARNFASAACTARVEHIIYLGGLADPRARIGSHMRSRIETGDVLRQGNVPVTEFRAGVIIGPGSISFEMIRYLTEQMPILVGPRWLGNRVQPIAIQDVLNYLLAALETPTCWGQVYEIGGADVMTYADTMLGYARQRGLKRRLLMLPAISLWLMAYGVDRLTPVPASIAGPLIEGMRSDSVVRDGSARRVFPYIQPLGYQRAVSDALSQLSPAQIEPVWDNGMNSVKIIRHEGFFIEFRQISLETRPEAVYCAFTGMGGKCGWLYLDRLWRLRGLLDRLCGGPGMRGRRDEEELREGDVVDFYRVEALEPGEMMRLKAELRAPGAGWMEWSVRPQTAGRVLLSQTAFFAPKGVLGFLYWYLLYPVHRLVFAGLVRKIARRASEIQRTGHN
jgi:uncharacterized protein YbjT (DUF2867 family)